MKSFKSQAYITTRHFVNRNLYLLLTFTSKGSDLLQCHKCSSGQSWRWNIYFWLEISGYTILFTQKNTQLWIRGSLSWFQRFIKPVTILLSKSLSSAFKASSTCSNHDVLPAVFTRKRNPMWNWPRSISSAKFFTLHC